MGQRQTKSENSENRYVKGKHRLILLTSNNCGHCHKFIQNELNDLKDKIKGRSNIEFIHEHLPTASREVIDNVFRKYPSVMKEMNLWFPMVLMIPSSVWVKGMKTKLKKDEIDIFNPRPNFDGITNTKNVIIWINKNLAKNSYKLRHSNPYISTDSIEKPVKVEKETSKEEVLKRREETPTEQVKMNFVSKKKNTIVIRNMT